LNYGVKNLQNRKRNKISIFEISNNDTINH
jgi:hypothetical protein